MFGYIKEVSISNDSTSVLIDWPQGREAMTFVLRGLEKIRFEEEFSNYLAKTCEMTTDMFGVGRLVRKRTPDWEI